MTKTDLIEKIEKIRSKADQFERLRMVPFASESEYLECPWLKWLCDKLDNQKHLDIRGLLLMQDWGTSQSDDGTIQKATAHLEDSSNGKFSDPTLRNLLSNDLWAKAISDRKVLVSNAVWGLRGVKGKAGKTPMCGYLGAKIHKRAFLTWGRLVAFLAKEANNPDFRLYVAGEWARFEDKTHKCGMLISVYLKHWKKWASNYSGRIDKFPRSLDDAMLDDCKGTVVFLRHPSVWHTSLDLEKDPFSEINQSDQ